MQVGDARVSAHGHDTTTQRNALTALDVMNGRIHVDHGLPGNNRDRPGLRQALAACRAGDTLIITELDRRARPLPDPRAIADDVTNQLKLRSG